MTDLQDRLAWVPDDLAALPAGRRVEAVVEFALEHLGRWEISQLFPNLVIETLTDDVLPLRLSHALHRGGARLSSSTVDGLLRLPNVGLGTVRAGLAALLIASEQAESVGPSISVGIGPRHRAEPSTAPVDELDGAAMEHLLDDLLTIARWRRTIGAGSRPVLEPEDAAPRTVREAVTRLQLLTADELLVPNEHVLDLPALLEVLLDGFDDRARAVLRDRTFATSPVRLEELGQRFGFTRERARQIESKHRAALLAAVSAEEPLAHIAVQMVAAVGALTSLRALLVRIPALGGEVPSLGQPAWLVLDRLDDAYEIADGWAAPDLGVAVEATREAIVAVADRHGVAPLDALLEQPSLLATLDRQDLGEWLEHCRFPVRQGHVLLRTRGIADWSAAILDLAGAAMTTESIDAEIPGHANARSLKNALSVDPRFVLTARDRWALAEWDDREYRGIAEEIGRVIDEHDGEVALPELQRLLVEQFGVAASSVYAYATRGAFGVHSGVVKRVGPRTLHTTKTPFLTKRLYRIGDGWTYRVVVNHEHLRGSGFSMPIALGAAIGIVDHVPRTFTSGHGPQTVHWNGGQVLSGSIRRFLETTEASLGDLAFLRFGDDGGFSVRVLATDEDLLDGLFGRPMDALSGADLSAEVGRAIGLDGAPIVEVLERLQQRDEADLAQSVGERLTAALVRP